MNCEHIASGLIPYLEGRATHKEKREVEAHLAGCAACRMRAEEFRKLWSVLDEAPITEPSLGFDGRIRQRIAAEPRRGFLDWLLPAPRLVFSLAALLALSILLTKLPPAQSDYSTTISPEKDYQMIKDLGVLENYDVLSNFDALSELPVVRRTPQQPIEQPSEQNSDSM